MTSISSKETKLRRKVNTRLMMLRESFSSVEKHAEDFNFITDFNRPTIISWSMSSIIHFAYIITSSPTAPNKTVAAILQQMKKQLNQVQDGISIIKANTTLLNGRYRSVYPH